MGLIQSSKEINAVDEEAKENFLKQLKKKYKQWYDAVQPIPYIRDRLYCVDTVFADEGIEYLAESYLPLESYHDVFWEPCAKSRRRVLTGDPGYGKSTLTLQYAYDWCNNVKESYLKDVEILILLRLRQLGGVPSIYKAIKHFLLPKDPTLTDHDIERILQDSSSVVVILDGFDEYPGDENDCTSDIMKIIMANMFEAFEVILTTRYQPKQCSSDTKLLRLTGFDDKARDEYIRKAVVGYNDRAVNRIKRRLQNNPVISDLCQVPLIFVMFAHMSHENEDFQTFKTVTSFFHYMIECFHSHLRNKMEEKNVRKCYLYEEDHSALDMVAFQGLCKKEQQINWSKQEMIDQLGEEFYDHYIKLGILVEEEILTGFDSSSSIASEQCHTGVRFYHKIFCEWYAAHYLTKYANRVRDPDNLRARLYYMDPFDLQYCYRFACGLNRNAAGKIIECVKSREESEKFEILCIVEQGGRVDKILGTVEDLFAKEIEFQGHDSRLLQRSTAQLLQIASSHKIPISGLRLINCYSRGDLSSGNLLQLKSKVSVPVLTTLKKLEIQDKDRDISAEELSGILKYSSKCLKLKELWFRNCQLPFSVQAESVSVLRSRDIKVMWVVYGCYRLDLTNGSWVRVDDSVMTEKKTSSNSDGMSTSFKGGKM